MDPTIRTGMSHHSFSLCGETEMSVYAELETASFFRWSMKTCRLTSSVRIGAPVSCRRTGRTNTAVERFTHLTNSFLWHNSDPVITLLNQNTFITTRSLSKALYSLRNLIFRPPQMYLQVMVQLFLDTGSKRLMLFSAFNPPPPHLQLVVSWPLTCVYWQSDFISPEFSGSVIVLHPGTLTLTWSEDFKFWVWSTE